MIRHLKKWWQIRRAKHYLNNYWHLIVDIILVLVVLELLIVLIFIKTLHIPLVSLSEFNHQTKDSNAEVATTTQGSLNIKSSVEKKNVSAGQIFVVHLNLENNGDNNISAIELTPKLSDGFNLANLENTGTSTDIKIVGRKIYLDSLAAGTDFSADISLSLTPDSDGPRNISWLLSANYIEANEKYTNNYYLPALKFITDLKMTAIAYYNSPLGDQLGSGPIPPIVGMPTNYWVFFNADNHGNDLSGLTVTATLPSGITLSNRKTLSAGEFSYNESQKRLTWTVKEVSVKNGLYQLGFEVQIIPSEKQINTEPLILNNISYLATDAYTGEKLSGKISALNTDLPADAINHGQGTVIK